MTPDHIPVTVGTRKYRYYPASGYATVFTGHSWDNFEVTP